MFPSIPTFLFHPSMKPTLLEPRHVLPNTTGLRTLCPTPLLLPSLSVYQPPQVAAELQNAPIGSVLFRPAMKPTLAERLSHISATIKLAALGTGPLMLNVDIKEAKDKPPKQVSVLVVWAGRVQSRMAASKFSGTTDC